MAVEWLQCLHYLVMNHYDGMEEMVFILADFTHTWFCLQTSIIVVKSVIKVFDATEPLSASNMQDEPEINTHNLILYA
jgi:hypothetical protein